MEGAQGVGGQVGPITKTVRFVKKILFTTWLVIVFFLFFWEEGGKTYITVSSMVIFKCSASVLFSLSNSIFRIDMCLLGCFEPHLLWLSTLSL